MSLDELTKAANIVVGTKQTVRAINDGLARKIFLAKDVDVPLAENIRGLCERNGVSLEEIVSMAELGKSVGIDVGAAVVAITE